MAKTKLRISSALQLPLDACTQTMAFIGKRGAGKTYAAGVLVEELTAAGCQVIILDPVGTWYGLRMPRPRGPAIGIPIPVLGGLRGDIGLTPESGELVAEMVVSTRSSVVLDVSSMLDSEAVRFTEHFVSRFHHLMKASPAPVHIVFEEAQTFAPQLSERGERTMLNRMKRLVKLGRNCGIGVSLLSQRPQAINKGVLNQTEMLVAFQLNGVHERKAIKVWATDKDLDVDLVDELPHLKVGDCWVWSPSWLNLTKRLRFREKTTLDASATPKFGAKTVEPKPLSKIQLTKLETSMGKAAEDAKAHDPKALRRRVLQLERELAKKPSAVKEVVKKEVSIITAKDRAALTGLYKKLSKAQAALENAERRMGEVLMKLHEQDEAPLTGKKTKSLWHPDIGKIATKVHQRRLQRGQVPKRMADAPAADTNGLGKRHREIIAAVFRQGRAVTKVQLAALVGLKHTGGTYNTYLSRCRTAGMLVGDGAAIQVTKAGAELAQADGHEQIPDHPDDIYDQWHKLLTGRTKDILALLWQCYPEEMAKDEIASELQMEPSGGTFNTYLSRLSSLKLVKRNRGSIAINGETFLLE